MLRLRQRIFCRISYFTPGLKETFVSCFLRSRYRQVLDLPIANS